MNNREHDLLRLSAVQFSAWELHMYLDTHPNDKSAAERYKKYMAQYNALLADFEQKYGPINQTDSKGNAWLSDPWPWDISKECEC